MRSATAIKGNSRSIKMTNLVSTIDDCSLLAAIAGRRDPDAFAELYRRYETIAYCVSKNLTGNSDGAAKAVQDAMLQVWLFASKFQKGNNVRGWLLRIVAHSSFRVIRSRRSRQAREYQVSRSTTLPYGNPNGAADEFEKKEELGAMRRALNAISEIERKILTLYYAVGYSQLEISEELGIPQRTISMKLGKVLRKLKRSIELSGIAAAAPMLSFESLLAVLTSGPIPPAHLSKDTLSRLTEAHAYTKQISSVLSRKTSLTVGSLGPWAAGV